MVDSESRSKIGAASLISLGYLGVEEIDMEEISDELQENVMETETEK